LIRLKAVGGPIRHSAPVFHEGARNMSHDASRRRFLTLAVAAAASAPVALGSLDAGAATAPAAAKPLPKLALTDPTAKALAYTENAANVKHAAFKAGSNCLNCNLYKGTKGQAYGPCTLFPKNTVAAKGWCSAWAKKP
jgi:High potential iron-sulfur protein